MGNIIYAAPYVPPNPPAADDLWPGLQMTWTGWDGSFWDIGNALEGISLQAGVRGLNMPRVEHFKDDHAGVYGSRWRGLNVPEREVFWPVMVFNDLGSMAWTVRDRAFWKTMNPKQTGVWTVIQPSGEARTLRCRFRDDGQHAFDIVPQKTGWTKYGITMDAEQPMWEGPIVERRWKAASSTSFFGMPLSIDAGHGASTARVDNKGDDDSWPEWTIEGPVTSVTVGVGGHSITAPITLSSGETLVIDTHPTAQTAIKNGTTDVFTSLTATDWAPIPPGDNVSLSISITGTGVVWCRFYPQHYKAW